MKNLKLIPLALIATLLMASCNSSYTLVKKRYSDGYHISKRSNTTTTAQSGPVKEKVLVDTASETKFTATQIKTAEPALEAPVTASVSTPIEVKKARAVSGHESGLAPSGIFKENKVSQKKIREAVGSENLAPGNTFAPGSTNILEILLAIFLPPVAVFLHTKALGALFWLDLLLTLLFWVPGVIMAFVVILM